MSRLCALALTIAAAGVLTAVAAAPAGALVPRKPISFRATVIASTLTGFFCGEADGRAHFVYANRVPAVGALVLVRALWDGHNRFWVYGSTGTSVVRTIGRRDAAAVVGGVGTLDRPNHRFMLLLGEEQATAVNYRTLQLPQLLPAAARPRRTHLIKLSLHGLRWNLVSLR